MKTPIYKRHQVTDLYCPECKQFLGGNGSWVMPYHCKCGDWEIEWLTGEWKLKERK